MGMIKFLVGFAFAALFAISIVSYVTLFAIDNDAPISISDDSNMNVFVSKVESNLIVFKSDIDTASNTYSDSKMQSGNDNIEAGTPFKTGPGAIIGTIFTMISTAKTVIFGEGDSFSIIFTTLFSFIVIIYVYYGWQLWKGGTP